jgi:hypothetical protein
MKHAPIDEGITRTYRFWARPLDKIPTELWQVVYNSQHFWNRLVELQEDVAFNCETLPENAPIIQARFWDLLTSREADCRKWRIAVKHAADLPWATRDAIFDRFVDSCIRAARKKGGWPRYHNRLERIMILHRFTGGGRAVRNIFFTEKQGRSWRFGLKPVPDSAYAGKTHHHTNNRLSTGFFGFSKDTKLYFRTVLHRQLPLDASVKNVAWVGRLHPIHGWQWAIAIMLRMASTSVERRPLPACGIDFGWRTRQHHIRVGMLQDSEGNVVELRLPFDAPTSKTRRHNMAYSYRDLIRIDSEIDNRINQAKAQIQQQALAHLPEDLQKIITELQKVREVGLVLLLRGFEAGNLTLPVQKILRDWLFENDRLRSVRSALQDRLIGRRRWFFRNIAAFLTKKYGTIALEDNFAAKAMIEDRATKDRDQRFKRSIRHYQWAAVAELRLYILEAAAKNGTQIVETETKWSTATCFICGKYTAHQSDLKLTCPSGHTWDQDINAAANILGGIEGLSKNRQHKGKMMVVPNMLREVMVAID